ncbi:MAG TPA: hypothetical protein VMX77_01565 [Candidatus Bathyarchaeia archaeon]|nr:hypothetical protein [Candidatus Bathyarchaeia archaeon]
MKQFSLNHLEFVTGNLRHNLFHWLVVVFLRLITSSISIFLSFYLASIGFLLSTETIGSFLPPALTEKINLYSNQLPFFPLIKQEFFSFLGSWYQGALTWWAMVVGLPLIVLGLTISLINLFNLFYSITSPFYNRTHCPFCKEPVKAR